MKFFQWLSHLLLDYLFRHEGRKDAKLNNSLFGIGVRPEIILVQVWLSPQRTASLPLSPAVLSQVLRTVLNSPTLPQGLESPPPQNPVTPVVGLLVCTRWPGSVRIRLEYLVLSIQLVHSRHRCTCWTYELLNDVHKNEIAGSQEAAGWYINSHFTWVLLGDDG